MDLPGGHYWRITQKAVAAMSQQKPTALNGTKINYLPVPTDFKGVFGKNVQIPQKLSN